MPAEAVRLFVTRNAIAPSGIVAAVSGGPDSTALLLALLDLRVEGFTITCGHVNHHLRGADSDVDEAFVRDLCRDRGIELHVADGTLDPAAVKARGVEAAAREIRTQRLSEIRSRVKATYVATEHLDRHDVEITGDATRFSSWTEESWARQALLHRHTIRLDPETREISSAD